METLRKKLEVHVSSLFPGYAVKKMKSVGKNPDTGKSRTETHEVVIGKNGATTKVFVKSFSGWFVDTRKDAIDFTIKTSKEKQVNVPEIYGFFRDINSYVMEAADGKLMSTMVSAWSSNPVASGRAIRKMEPIVREVARSIAFLQSHKPRLEAFSYRSFVLDKSPELERFIGSSKRLSNIVEDVEGNRIVVGRGYNDVKLGNILVSGNDIKFIDPGVFEYKWYFINPVAFSVSLRLTQRVPLLNGGGLLHLRRAFYDEYFACLKWKTDPDFMDNMEVLKKCELLCYFTSSLKAGVPIRYRIPMRINVRCLRRDIRDFHQN